MNRAHIVRKKIILMAIMKIAITMKILKTMMVIGNQEDDTDDDDGNTNDDDDDDIQGVNRAHGALAD